MSHLRYKRHTTLGVNKLAVDTRSKAYNEMLAKWQLPLALLGGTNTMREQSSIWLPKMPDEDEQVYNLRVKRSFLFNVYSRTIESMVGNAFSSNITLSNIPDKLQYLEWNATGSGESLTEVAAKLFRDSLIFGKCHSYVDFPDTEIDRVSQVEYDQMGLRPYIARISPISLIGWDLEYNNGFENINHVRLVDEMVLLNDNFEEEYYEVIRVVYRDRIVTYKRPKGLTQAATGKQWEEAATIPNTLGYVPLQTGYANKTGTFTANPTLEDLAWLNLQHFQSSSDQSNILHIARVPILLGVGFNEKDSESVTLAANQMIITDNKDATIKYVEHTGQAIAAGRQHGKDIEEQMHRAGAEILFSQSVARQTATARKVDQQQALSVSQQSLRSIEQMLEQAFYVAADWLDYEEPFEPTVNIGADLDLADDPNPINSFIELSKYFGLSPEAALEDAKRRGLLAKHITLKDIDILERETLPTASNADVVPPNLNNEPDEDREDQ